MFIRSVVLCLGLCLLFPVIATAEDPPKPIPQQPYGKTDTTPVVETLKRTAGTIQLGGPVTFSIDKFSNGDSKSGGTLDISPSIGYFILDNFQLSLATSVKLRFGSLYENSAKDVGFFFGGRYIFRWQDRLYPYIGANFGPEFAIPSKGKTVTFFGVNTALGLLVPIVYPNVALNFGFGNQTLFAVSGASGSLSHIPIGFIGLEVFI